MSDDAEGNVIQLHDRDFPDPEPEREYTLADHYRNLYENQKKLNKALAFMMVFLVLAIMIGGPLLGRYADDRTTEATTEARIEMAHACQERVADETARIFSLVCSGEKPCPKRELP